MTTRRSSPARKHPRTSESRLVRIDALLDYAEEQIEDIARSYDAQLQSRQVPLELCIKVKNCCENLRSALVYFAHYVFECTYPGAPLPARLAFPLLSKRPDSDAKSGIQNTFPQLRAINRELWNDIERFQPYKRRNGWLRRFNRVVNDNKHWDIAAQSRRKAAIGSPQAGRLGPVVFRLESEAIWIEYRFRGLEANAFFLLEQAQTNIRHFIQEATGHLR